MSIRACLHCWASASELSWQWLQRRDWYWVCWGPSTRYSLVSVPWQTAALHPPWRPSPSPCPSYSRSRWWEGANSHVFLSPQASRSHFGVTPSQWDQTRSESHGHLCFTERLLVVIGGNRAEAFLSGSIPDLQFARLAINVHSFSFLPCHIAYEINSYSVIEGLGELVLTEPGQNARLADPWVADDQQFKELAWGHPSNL